MPPLSPAQMHQFREAFLLVDHDKDGRISLSDIRHILTSLGMSPTQATLDALLEARPGTSTENGIDFTLFLTMMSERLFQFDPESDLTDAFSCFDEADSGLVKVDEMRKWMADVGERMDQEEIDRFFKGPFTDRHGNFNYRAWIKMLSVNDNHHADA